MLRQLTETFHRLYRDEPRIFRAPGRVNLIGEHTDYNDGFVLPAAIDREILVAAAPRPDRQIHVFSLTFSERAEFDLDEKNPRPRGHWSDYIRGVALILESVGYRLGGANLLIESNLPIGAGLSSSAALEVATAIALSSLAEIEIPRAQLAKLCQRAENEFVGMRCGIMDQLIACFAQPGHALLIDCRSLERQMIPLDESKARIVLCNTMVKHKLASSEYNTRRAECEEGVRLLSQYLPGIRALRDVTQEDFARYEHELPERVRCRSRHVISENERVLVTAQHLLSNDFNGICTLMAASHKSLRDDYQVSSVELDLMVELANRAAGVHGARMTGGGFGGCTVNLVASDAVEEFCSTVQRAYYEATGIQPEIYVCRTTGAAGEI